MRHRSRLAIVGARQAARRATDSALLARARSSDSVTVFVALGVALIAAATLPFDETSTLLAFVVLVAAGEMFQVTLPNDVPYSLGLAPGVGFALLGHQPLPETLLVFAGGSLLATLVRAARRRALLAADSATHLLALCAAAIAYNSIERVGGLPAFHTKTGSSALSVFGLLAMLVIIPFIETSITALRAIERDGVLFRPVFASTARATIALHLSIVSVGALLALAYPALRSWSFPLFLAPLAATQYAFRQFARIRTTYLQTIRALSKVPEMAGYTQEGHSRRVADLSVAVARELGVQGDELREIEYAALLHDIGRLSVNDPEQVEHADASELAVMGATIVRQTGHFPRVADMIENQHLGYRRPGEDSDEGLSAGSRIIKVASAYDDLTRPGGIGHNSWDALERLHLGMAYDFDPVVIQALTRALEKQARSA
jgi:putative nucleotidyltransferase with HDIG domain